MNDPEPRDHWIRAALERFERRLTLYAWRIVGDIEVARDVVQDTFLKLCDQDRALVEPHLAEWLYTVCRNRAIDVRRRERRRTEMNDDQWLEGSAAPGGAPSAAVEVREEAGRILRWLEGLTDNQREVLRLRFQHSLSYREIAEVTGLTVTNVGFLIHTGIKALRSRAGVAGDPTVRPA